MKPSFQPLDYAQVAKVRNNLPPRPKLSESTHVEVQEKLQEHNDAVKKKIDENEIKIAKQQNLTKKEKDKKNN